MYQVEVFASDCMRLPFRSGVFDAAISIAVLHHFSSEVLYSNGWFGTYGEGLLRG